MSAISILMEQAKKYPTLSRKREEELFERYSNGDDRSREILLASHILLVIKCANKYKGYVNERGVTNEDLIQAGFMGMIKGLDKFDRSYGYRFMTFAPWWINAYIRNFVMCNIGPMKFGTTDAERRLFFKMSKFKEEIMDLDEDKEEARKQFAYQNKIKLRDIKKFEERLSTGLVSVDSVCPRTNMSAHNLILSRSNTSKEVESNILTQNLRNVINSLNLSDRERCIIKSRTLSHDPSTLQKLAKKLNVSRERIRQIENKVIDKIKNAYIEAYGL